MAMRKTSIVIFLIINIVFFTFSSACDECVKPKPKPKPKPKRKPPPPPSPPPPELCPPPPPPPPELCPPPPPPPSTPCPTCHLPPPAVPAPATCPMDIIKFGICSDFLSGLIGIIIGIPPKAPCCGLFEGLVDLEAAHCVCSACKANILGINLDISVSLNLLLNGCSKTVPSGFQCG